MMAVVDIWTGVVAPSPEDINTVMGLSVFQTG